MKIKSFTLIEIIVSIGVLALVIAMITGILLAVIKSNRNAQVLNNMQISGQNAVKTLNDYLRKANYVSCVSGSTVFDCENEFSGNFIVVGDSTGDEHEIGFYKQNNDSCPTPVTNPGYLFIREYNSSTVGSPPSSNDVKLTVDDFAGGNSVNVLAGSDVVASQTHLFRVSKYDGAVTVTYSFRLTDPSCGVVGTKYFTGAVNVRGASHAE